MNEQQKLERALFFLLLAFLCSIIFCLVAVFTLQEEESRIEHINNTQIKY